MDSSSLKVELGGSYEEKLQHLNSLEKQTAELLLRQRQIIIMHDIPKDLPNATPHAVGVVVLLTV